MGATITIERIDPEMAARLLETNTKNRPLDRRSITAMIRDMREGRWQFNAAPIVVDETGKLADGQHKLTAIVESGVTVETSFAIGVSEDAFETIESLGQSSQRVRTCWQSPASRMAT